MEKLNNYLQQLLNTCGFELHLEPNKNPYIVTPSGQVEASANPLPGAQINSMIFSLIPNNVKQQLPNQPVVEFVHPHNLGAFNFNVKKSPAGFNVVISPAIDSGVHANDGGSPEYREHADNFEQLTPAAAGSNQASPKSQAVISENQPADAANPEAGPAESYSPFAKGRYEDPDPDSIPEIEIEGDVSFEAGNEFEPDEFPGSRDSYQTTYESPVVEFESNDHASTYEIDEVDTKEETNFVSEFTVESQLTSETEQEQVVHHSNFATPVIRQPEMASVEQTDFEHKAIPVFEESAHSVPAVPVSNQNEAIPAAVESHQPAAEAYNSFNPVNPEKRAEMDALFRKMAEVGASDLHLSVSMPPLVRNDGKMKELAPGSPVLDAGAMKSLLTSIMPEQNQKEFEEKCDTDFAYEIPGLARFRVNVFRDRKGMGGVFRIIPADIMTAEDLGLSKAIMKLCELSKGLVVVTGPTGSGKSTTLCAMVDWINKNREEHIITIEDPIEFTHENKKCLVNQREVNNHTRSFKNALRAALREDPDIVLVGEMRDLETVSIAIETAETGHLVFGTLHTTTAASTVDRIIDQFPADRQQQIRVMLSESLKGVIAQTLVPKIGGGRIAALETLVVTPAIANLIREGKTFQIQSQMQTGKNLGMALLNDSLMELVNKGLVEPKDAYIKAVDKDNFESLLQRNGKKL